MKFSDPPCYQTENEGVFRDTEHFRTVASTITRALFGQRRIHHHQSTYFFDTLQVEFSTSQREEEIYLDYLNSKVILRAPQRSREAEKSMGKRRMHYLGFMLKYVEAMKVLGITHIYLAISAEGRAKLEEKGPET